jgi:poly(A) polymerase
MRTPKITSEWLANRHTQAVFHMLAAGGHKARVVGGAVRNALLDEPVTDIDIATTAEPADVIRLAEEAHHQVAETGLKHGTVTVIVEGHPFEVTTLRKDLATDGRHAEVAYTVDWVADASRRDFTMNALYCEADGTIYDPLGGLADIGARRVRFIGNPHDRIREDYLRILRFFRFFAQYSSGTPDEAAMLACVQERGGLTRLSGERIRQEFVKLVCAPRASDAIAAMFSHGLLTELLTVAPNPEMFNRMLARDTRADAALRLAALTVHAREDAGRLAGALRLSNAERATLAAFAAVSEARSSLPDLTGLRELLYRLGEARYRCQILAMWAIAGAPPDDRRFAEACALPVRWSAPKFPLTGRDVVTLGVRPGPRVGAALAHVEAAWIAGDFAEDRDALFVRLREILKADGAA